MYVMGPMEIVLGWVEGTMEPAPASPSDDDPPEPSTAIEAEILAALRRPPCGVSFSGGRDSSAVLAIAVDLAGRHGLPLPIPITNIFPDAPETDESEWQELVIGHLGLDDWVRLTLHDDLDLVGPLATTLLRRHDGVVWPPLVHSSIPALDVVPNGSLLTGEGGDEVLGVDSHRIAHIARMIRHPRATRRRHLIGAADSLAPARWRARRLMNDPDGDQRWLRRPAAAVLRRMVVEEERRKPLGFEQSVRSFRRERAVILADRNEERLAADHDVQLVQPLSNDRVVDALAGHGGWLGPGDRTAVLRRLVGDLLPDAVLTRTSKVDFDATFMSAPTKEFAERWDGSGLDDDLVDTQMLRDIWCSDERPGLSGPLLQAAWLATHGAKPQVTA
jgi:asparagine synthase (glutamine-hydrolysing)